MTPLDIFYLYVPLYLVRNILTFINFLIKKKRGELDQVTEITAEMGIEHAKKSSYQVAMTIFEIGWGTAGWFTPFGYIFIAMSVNNIIRMWIAAKAPREKASSLFTLNSLVQISMIGYLTWLIYSPLL